jgi:hypothetical protein
VTLEQIVVGLRLVVERLSLHDSEIPPDDFEEHEWAYVKGVASHAIWQTVLHMEATLRAQGRLP